MEKEIGKIIEVRGIKVKAKLFKLLPPYLVEGGEAIPAPRINTFVKTKVGLDTIICQICGEYNIEQNDKVCDYYLDLEVKGFIENGKFCQGLRMLPIVSANIILLENKDYEIIYKYNSHESFSLGNDLFDINRKIYLNYNKLIPSHIGIFGNTGSGKSNTLACILNNYISKLNDNKYKKNSTKIIIFDLNNEYGKDAICKEEYKTIYNLTTRKESEKKTPLKFDDLDEDEMQILLDATLKTQAPVLKQAFNQLKKNHDESYYCEYIKNTILNKQRDLFFAIRNYLHDYVKGLDNIVWHSQNQTFYVESISDKKFLDNLNYDSLLSGEIKVTIPKDKLDRLKFEICFAIAKECTQGINSDYLLPLIHRSEKLFNDFKKVFDFESKNDLLSDGKVCVIQLANVNEDMTDIIPGLLARTIFNRKVQEKDGDKVNSIVNIVIDEAHNILYKEDDSNRHRSVLENFEKIIKEGRKFGVYLFIASQRPSDISGTILSQLHNYFIHKLVNPNDLSQIRKTVAFLDEEAMNFITILAPGECIISGTTSNMPVFLKIDELDENAKPNSSNVILIGDGGIIENIPINNEGDK